MHFSPVCGNLLLITDGSIGMRFCCPTCPYIHNINKRYVDRVKTTKKQIDYVLGGAEAWENVDKTTADCPFCKHGQAYFKQIQIRSADEPSTVFYKCCQCMGQWNDR